MHPTAFSITHLSTLWIILVVLILLSSFFSIAETAYMSVNRYRLRHMVKQQGGLAKRAALLLDRPDRLLGVILLGDTFADISASALATLLAVHYLGDIGVIIATLVLTLIVLIFGEVAPKTLAALHPTPIVLRTAWPLWILLKILYPFVWAINILSNGLLRLLGIATKSERLEHLTTEELRTVVLEASRYIPAHYQQMLLQLLDLEKRAVEDIMVPRQEIAGLDISKSWEILQQQLPVTAYIRLPVYEEHIDKIKGILHLRDAVHLLAQDRLNKETLLQSLETPYFIPAGTSLGKQLLYFCQQKLRMGLVVNEYGDILGLVTLEDILEEIVGEFTTDTLGMAHQSLAPQADGSYLIDGSLPLRELNRTLSIHFPLDGPKTLNGLLTEYLETLPPANVCVTLQGYRIEILQVKGHMIKTVRLWLPPI